ncbi:RagB/SusD family nutrient uptake outer membrane protein [Dyadobacter chenwenxiniae]|uniref:RagB/SusD family nutrient uptake outer membrane protein n=1 Tax=Dyadobacter chenwenxiniae TaxID=2906456 RepID=A0A9X1PP17_9BACT|nr:RagB/SusD family nutrient uptake outer membrane protein [Dyadobacter chenwenxiniae]MCF0063814.1 RagB/SusD family nutrient uptake outer membrane protein [Dyadobacter chenwenxiniae]UON83490.1 RagB/SusD family nutrient uptake outer membrane protein [Dyadobacter chenwenxiniae]
MKKNLILSALLMVAASACNEDFLERLPQSSIAPEAFFNTEEDLALYINGLVSLPGTSSYLNDQSTDNATTTGAVEVKVIMTGTPSSQTIEGGWDWERLRNVNYFLDNYNKAATSSQAKAHYVGLARYYRAQFYLDKVARFSDVPWYSKTLNPGDKELYKTQDPRALVMDSVMADLAFASENVRESVPSGTPGKWAVMTEYARAALFEGTYRKYHTELNLRGTANRFLEVAATTSEAIIKSGKFSIYSTGKPQQDYATLFASQDLLSNPEVIVTNVYDQNKKKEGSVNSSVFGDYEQAPSRDLIQSYLMKDGTPFTNTAGYQEFGFVKEFANRDPRLSQTMVYPGWVRLPDATPYIQRLNKNFTGYHQLKGYMNTTDNNIQNSADFPAYRYAEVLLTYAEAKAELGTLTQADLDISVNLLRKRVGMPDLNLAAANAKPDPVLVGKYPNVAAANRGVLLEIRRERRVEFAFENLRFNDLMRWHAGALLTKIPEGMYFKGPGKYDLTGDGIDDIILINKNTAIPAEASKEKNSLGVVLIYYKTGAIGEDVTVYLKNGLSGGTMVTETAVRKFEEPKYYYRPIPQTQMLLNPELKQVFGWK